MGARAVLEWHEHGDLRARFYKQWGSPGYQIPRLADWLTVCADQGARPTVQGYVEHAYTADVELIREPFPTHGQIPGDVEHVYMLVMTAGYGYAEPTGQLRVSVTSRDLTTGITHHHAGTADLAELHTDAATLLEQMAERAEALRHGMDPSAADRLYDNPDDLTERALRHRAHALGYAHA